MNSVGNGEGKSFLGREHMRGRRRGETVFSEHVVNYCCSVQWECQKVSKGGEIMRYV